MLRYNEDHGDGEGFIVRMVSTIYLMDKQFMWDAFQASQIPESQRTVEQRQLLAEFAKPMKPIMFTPMVKVQS